VRTLGAITLLVGAARTLGGAAVPASWPELRPYERASLRLTAGLGLTALLLSILALLHWFAIGAIVLAAITCIGIVAGPPDGGYFVQSVRTLVGRVRLQPDFGYAAPVAVAIAAIVGCLGAIAPVTDDDALAFVMPTARHIADAGALRVWSDQARSMFPQSQQVLVAFALRAGGERVGAVTALEWLLCLGVVGALARRLCERADHIPVVLAIAFGAPVAAFQIASAKEDLLLVAAAAASVFCLSGPRTRSELAAAGLFAGIAAGAKYSGLGVAIAAIAWTAATGLASPGRRPTGNVGVWPAIGIVAGTAMLAGGIWYLLNAWRFSNPIAPFVLGARGTHFDAALASALGDGFGAGRGPLAFLIAPGMIFVEPGLFCGRGNLFNPLAYAGLAALAIPAARRRHAVPLFVAGVLYVGWFLTLQNARLLLPAAVVLAPAAADRVMALARGRRLVRRVTFATLAAGLGLVAAVAVVRAARYVREPSTYLARETQRYDDIAWMNAHLDPARHRVAASAKVIGYLTIPTLVLDPTRQLEIGPDDLSDPDRLLASCRRAGITHLFGRRGDFDEFGARVRLVHDNPASRLGGVRFFREPPIEATAVYEIVAP